MQHFLAVAGAGVSRLSTLILLLLGSQVMLPDEFGIFALLFMISGMISAIVSGGGDMWLNQFTRYHSASEGKSPFVSKYYLIISGNLGLFFVVSSVLAIILSIPLLGTTTQVIGFALLYGTICGINEAFLAILRTTNRVSHFFIIRDLFLPLLLTSLVILLKISNVRDFFAISSGIFGAFSLCMLAFFIKHEEVYIPKNKRLKFKMTSFFSYTFALIANNLSSRLAAGLDSIVLTFFIPLSILGHYRLCTQLANGFIVVQHFVFLALPWHFHSSSDRLTRGAGIKEIHYRHKLLMLSAFPILIFLILFSKEFLSFLGPEAVSLQTAFITILFVRFCDILWGPLHERLVSNGKIIEDIKANILAILIWLFVFSLYLQNSSPVTAACIGVACSSFSAQFLRYNILKKYKLIMPKPVVVSSSSNI